MRGKTKTIICSCGCGRPKSVRISDIKRGWGKYYSKSCKAAHQEQKTGQYTNHLELLDKKDNGGFIQGASEDGK